MKKIKIVAVVGPTASGKTQLGVDLCKRLKGEVVSADSMQIYKKMNIATAKPSAAEMDGIPHHLIDFLEPTESFSVVEYCELARKCIEDISGRGKLPIVVGGTGLYIDALLNNIEFPMAKVDLVLRDNLKELALAHGAEYLLEELRKIDPETAQNLHPKDLGRIIRALELYYSTGVTMARHIQNSRLIPSPYDVFIIGLNFKNRQMLYERINIRINTMLKEGLIEEAKLFLNEYSSGTAQQAIGYKELAPYLDGSTELFEVVEKLKQGTRQYAKRQLTWFRKNSNIQWIYADDYNNPEEIVEKALAIIKSSGILN